MRHHHEAAAGCFIAEGVLVIRRLARSPYRIRSVLLAPNRVDDLAADLVGVAAPVYVAERPVLDAVVGFRVHRGALAAADRLPVPPATEVLGGSVVLLVEDVNNHENLGGLFRNAAAFGAGAVLLSPRCCDPLYRRCVRVSLGHVLHTRYAWIEPWPDGIDVVRSAGYRVVALTPDRAAGTLAELARGPRTALLVGAEGPGLSAAAMARADRLARIPMADGVDSLNVATAAAVALHHLRPA